MPPAQSPGFRLRTEIVRAAMEHQKITSLDALAVRIGVGRATVVRAMSGVQGPSARLLAALVVHLELPLDSLVDTIADPSTAA